MSEPTHFHSYIIKGVYNKTTDESGWRIVGLWGDEEKGEGNRIGPTFSEEELEACEKECDQLVEKHGLPVEIATIWAHYLALSVGQRVNTTDGPGTIQEIRPGVYSILVKLDDGGLAWQNKSNILPGVPENNSPQNVL